MYVHNGSDSIPFMILLLLIVKFVAHYGMMTLAECLWHNTHCYSFILESGTLANYQLRLPVNYIPQQQKI